MRQPSRSTYVLGNNGSVLLIFAFCGLMLQQWWVGHVDSDWAPIAAVLAMAAAGGANRQLSDFKRFKRNWEAMGGSTVGKPFFGQTLRALGILAWVMLGIGLFGLNYRDPSSLWIAGFWGIATAVWVWRRLPRSAPLRRRLKAAKLVVVAISLPKPRRSPGRAEILHLLPAYCAGVLEPARAAERTVRHG